MAAAPGRSAAAGGSGQGWASIAGGFTHACGIRVDASLWCWGFNEDGQVGDGTNENRRSPSRVAGGARWLRVATGTDHACAIRRDRTLWCWGRGTQGELGEGAPDIEVVPVPVAGGGRWLDVSANYQYTCGVQVDGTLWCWGNNDVGRLGDGTDQRRDVPTRIAPGTTWSRVSAGFGHACAVRDDATLWCWGNNYNGQLGHPTADLMSRVPVRVDGERWADVSAGEDTTCGIRADATLWCWGADYDGEVGDGTTGAARPEPTPVAAGSAWSSVSTGYSHTCGVRRDGALYCWGQNLYGELGDGREIDSATPQPVAPGTDWSNVTTSGWAYTCGVRADHSGWCWGRNAQGQLGDGTGLSSLVFPDPVAVPGDHRWRAVSTGAGDWTGGTTNGYACGLDEDQALWCWGRNGSGQLGDGTTTDRYAPVQVAGALRWSSVEAAGDGRTCGIDVAGGLWCWGDDTHYPGIGLGTGSLQLTPVQVQPGTRWRQVDLDWEYGCGVRSDGTLWCWGDVGLLDGFDGAATRGLGVQWTPVRIGTGGSWATVRIGGHKTCGLRSDGTLTCTGYDTVVETGGSWSAVAVSSGDVCALRPDAGLWCGGSNGSGQLGSGTVSPGVEPMTPVAAGGRWTGVFLSDRYACGIRDDATGWCWGANGGRFGNGSLVDSPTPTVIRPDWRWRTLAVSGEYACGVRADATLWCWGTNHDGELGGRYPQAGLRRVG